MKAVKLMGINVLPVGIDDGLQMVLNHIPNKKGEYFCFANVHLVVEGSRDSTLLQVLNQAEANFADGMAVACALKCLGNSFSGRVRGTDLMLKLCFNAAREKINIFLYGNTSETLERLNIKLKQLFPELQIVGQISPPFRRLTFDEEEVMIEKINKTDPDILFVSLGAPKQEIWMSKNKGKIRAVQLGVGAAFDFITGNVQQAPVWMQRSALEWLFRMPQQPRKTIYRMSLLPSFASKIFLERIKKCH